MPGNPDTTWTLGDLHECPLSSYEHPANTACATYAVTHGDRMYAGNVEHDPVHHPMHYTSSPATCSGCGKPIECIDVTRHLSFDVGNVIEQLEKAAWYLADEIARRKTLGGAPRSVGV